MSMASLLQVRNLTVRFQTPDGVVQAATDINFDLEAGELLGIVGESGCGKSQLLNAILGLLAANGTAAGSIRYHGMELIGAPENAWRRIRGCNIGMVFQDPMTALNPYLTVGQQLTEGLRHHLGMGRRSAKNRAIDMLSAVHLAEPERRLAQYPHELSGGMRQRVTIAMALICEPDLLLADEPTTALDVTIQAQVLSLLRELRERFNTAMILVTHDLGVISEVADRVAVMYAGRIVETGTLDEIYYQAAHPYARALQNATLRLDRTRSGRLATIPGSPPNLSQVTKGCAFAPRCSYRMDQCDREQPVLMPVSSGHLKACFYSGPIEQMPKTEMR